ncbi:hypothetical protein EXIGLDRAFT_171764 [Exidia glandulosa HHB12029]|uniref:Uncharacterized protein n=1 Tax=Exidia glandulosa HHB12029 TaxID=1314781 RepID=A0A165FAG2_EXIGL|nr:hypothetical protein EXIGLDRAFT_171764 [Exidia glandulosa HHB12029]
MLLHVDPAEFPGTRSGEQRVSRYSISRLSVPHSTTSSGRHASGPKAASTVVSLVLPSQQPMSLNRGHTKDRAIATRGRYAVPRHHLGTPRISRAATWLRVWRTCFLARTEHVVTPVRPGSRPLDC